MPQVKSGRHPATEKEKEGPPTAHLMVIQVKRASTIVAYALTPNGEVETL